MRHWLTSIPLQIQQIFIGIFAVLIVCSAAFYLVNRLRPSDGAKELIKRNNTWWKIAIWIFIVATANIAVSAVVVGFVSFIAMREMLSISPLRESDRMAFFLAYLAIPVQYYLVYKGYFNGFVVFISVAMFIIIPGILVMAGKTERIGRSMSFITSILLMTVFMPSHSIMLFHLDFPGFALGGAGLFMYIIMLVAFNDVFQFTWGKLLGSRKILPNVSPNKTWEGFILGALTTAGLAVLIVFLTPLTKLQSAVIGLIIGVCGFIGDAILSAIKRDLKLKDTGDVLPGHGGVMDRLDSMVFAMPVYYHIMRYISLHL